jgi:hypothetical protein
MIEARCHCGQFHVRVAKPETITRCNCSICSKLGWALAYYPSDQVEYLSGRARMAPYVHGDRTLTAFHCPTCGCQTHWIGRDEHARRTGVNARLFDLKDVEGVTVHFLDGADSWKILGETTFGNWISCI